jgi:hypothetical protein
MTTYNAKKQARYRERLRAREALLDDPMKALVQACIAKGVSTLDTNTDPFAYARRRFGQSRETEMVLRAAVAPASLGSPEHAVLATTAPAFLAALAPASAGADLLDQAIQLSFDGAAVIGVPAIAIPVAAFVGEGAPIPVQPASTSPGPTLSPRKIAVITSLTGEMMRSSNAEAMVRQVLTEACGPAIDLVMFSAAPGDGIKPPGLLNGIPPLAPAADMISDLVALASAVAPVASNGEIAFVAPPGQAVGIALKSNREFAYQVLTSSSLAAGTVIAVALNALVGAAEGPPQIDVSIQATIHEETAPGPLVDIGGVMATPIRSMTQTDSVGLRLRWPISWVLRSPAAVAWVEGVAW